MTGHGTDTIAAWTFTRGEGVESLRRVALPSRATGPNEVRVRMHTVSLNARDLHVAADGSGTVVAASDGAGVVAAVGAAVTRWKVGDRVVPAFYPAWHGGEPMAGATASGLGGSVDGVLAESIVAHEDALVSIPDGMDFDTAATLACAGLTAWNALFVSGNARAGDTVLLLGTGGVSTWALQLAKAGGLRTIATTSDETKRERLRSLGADATINYRTTPDWSDEVLRLTGGRGVDLVLEVGGEATLGHSLRATRFGGTVAMIGGVSGSFGAVLEPFALIGGAKRLVGVLVGHTAMLGDLARFVAHAGLRPAVDQVFGFDDVPAAFARLASGRHLGKVVVSVVG